MTTAKYKSMSGRPTNLLGKLLEDYQFSDKPRYDIIAEALWFLSDPDDYKAKVVQNAKNEVIADTARKLKTEQNKKTSAGVQEEKRTEKTTRKIKKQQNIFKR